MTQYGGERRKTLCHTNSLEFKNIGMGTCPPPSLVPDIEYLLKENTEYGIFHMTENRD